MLGVVPKIEIPMILGSVTSYPMWHKQETLLKAHGTVFVWGEVGLRDGGIPGLTSDSTPHRAHSTQHKGDPFKGNMSKYTRSAKILHNV